MAYITCCICYNTYDIYCITMNMPCYNNYTTLVSVVFMAAE